ncbi:SRPBCC domain-containing protein [Gulosibacter bifidus]|uniref:SRPBCC domain-containing protein n=1 Tax=Gulosibacter bifidus TaxID=272239 RepID=A0ABW5RKC8_9MICO|nr:SRPBCC domain-containing protein [Gulosibacter bifidus]
MSEINGSIARNADGYRVTYSLDLDFDRANVWHAITDRAALENWLGTFSAPLERGNTFELEYLNDSDYTINGYVVDCTAPNSLEYKWEFNDQPEMLVYFTVTPGTLQGSTLHLTVSGLTVDNAVRVAATWHAQLEFLRDYLTEGESPAYALRFRRDELAPAYAKQLAIYEERVAAMADEASHAGNLFDNAAETMSVMRQHAHLA